MKNLCGNFEIIHDSKKFNHTVVIKPKREPLSSHEHYLLSSHALPTVVQYSKVQYSTTVGYSSRSVAADNIS